MGKSVIFISAFIGFGVIYYLLCMLASRSGWHSLAEYYKAEGDFNGRKWKNQYAFVGMSDTGNDFNGSLTVGANGRGLFLSVRMLLFGHPPLLIPWSDISIRSEDVFGETAYIFSTARVPGVEITMAGYLLEKIASACPENCRLSFRPQASSQKL